MNQETYHKSGSHLLVAVHLQDIEEGNFDLHLLVLTLASMFVCYVVVASIKGNSSGFQNRLKPSSFPRIFQDSSSRFDCWDFQPAGLNHGLFVLCCETVIVELFRPHSINQSNIHTHAYMNTHIHMYVLCLCKETEQMFHWLRHLPSLNMISIYFLNIRINASTKLIPNHSHFTLGPRKLQLPSWFNLDWGIVLIILAYEHVYGRLCLLWNDRQA